MLKKLHLTLALSIGMACASQAATIVWGAGQDNGFSLQSGAELAQNNLIRLGYFNLTDAAILSAFNIGDLTTLKNGFTEFATARVGDGLGVPSNFSKSSTANDSTLGIIGQQIYLWAFFSTDLSTPTTAINTVTQMGIFYLDKAVKPAWTFPTEGPPPGSTSIDLSDLTNTAGSALVASGAHLVVGTFPTGTSSASGSPNFGLRVVVPEPTSLAMLAVGLLAVSQRRRRNS